MMMMTGGLLTLQLPNDCKNAAVFPIQRAIVILVHQCFCTDNR